MEQREETELVEEEPFQLTQGQKVIAMMVGGCLSLYPIIGLIGFLGNRQWASLLIPTLISSLVYVVFMIWKTTKMIEEWNNSKTPKSNRW